MTTIDPFEAEHDHRVAAQALTTFAETLASLKVRVDSADTALIGILTLARGGVVPARLRITDDGIEPTPFTDHDAAVIARTLDVFADRLVFSHRVTFASPAGLIRSVIAAAEADAAAELELL